MKNKWMCLIAALFAAMVMSWCASAATEIVDGITWTYLVSGGEARVYGENYYGGNVRAVPTYTVGDVVIPKTLGGCPVTCIDHDAFQSIRGITSITIPSSVIYIGASAFSSCDGLTNVVMSANVKEIGQYAFTGCSRLSHISIPPSVKEIGQSAFYGCSRLSHISIPPSVMHIGALAFEGCYGLGEGVVIIDGCVLGVNEHPVNLTLPDGTRLIADGVFANCRGLNSVCPLNNFI